MSTSSDIKTILVCLTTEHNAERLTKAALGLAERFGAHLIGIHTIQALMVYPGVDIYLPDDSASKFHQSQREETERIKAIFEKVTGGGNVVCEWRSPRARTANASHRLIEHARCADLVVMGQADPEHDRMDQTTVQRDVIQQGGRPVLVVPHSGTFETIGTHILIGWSATCEATRAAHDAIPFMKDNDVRLMWVASDDGEGDYLDITAHEMAASLDRHGAKVTVDHWSNPDIAIGDVLLNEAFDRGCDMIVTGAFGHSRFYDFVIGATTTHLLKHMTVPVLFSN